jgi:ATP-dependent Clp endopeptidase proteolytic subunit ClpP
VALTLDLTQMQEQGVNLETRTIFLVGEINEDMCRKFLVNFQLLDSTDGTINVWLSSDGGSEPDGYAIYDVIKAAANQVRVIVVGYAFSMAAVILQAADVRAMTRRSRLMLHNGSVSIDNQHTMDTEKFGEELKVIRSQFCQVLAERTGLKKAEWARRTRFDLWLGPSEALKLNLIDEIIKEPKGS